MFLPWLGTVSYLFQMQIIIEISLQLWKPFHAKVFLEFPVTVREGSYFIYFLTLTRDDSHAGPSLLDV